MAKLILMSILIATIGIPMRHIWDEDPERALRKTVVEFCWFNLAYVLAAAYLVPRLS